MNNNSRYKQKLPGVLRCIGKYISDNADRLAGDIDDTTEFELTISVSPGDGDTTFVPLITTDREYIVRPALKYYYDIDLDDFEQPKEGE